MLKYFFPLFLIVLQLHATPQFAKEYGMQCSACHSAIPVLNQTGRSFLRNGFKFSFSEKTTWEKLTQEHNTTYIPAAVMFNVKYNSITKEVKAGIKPFIAGTFTPTDAIFITFGKNKNIYYQKNIHKQNHVLRAGFLSPYTQISSINKITASTGISCNNDDCQEIFKSPLQLASIQSIKGGEYSYQHNNTTYAISLGVTQDNTKQKTCVDMYDTDYANKVQLTLALSHTFYDYHIGFIYGKIQDSDLTNASLVTFIQKDFSYISFHLAYVYSDEKLQTSYQGFENMISYRYDPSLFFKGIWSYDYKNIYHNKSALIGFEKNYQHFLISLYGGKREVDSHTDSLIQTAIKLYF